MFSRCGGLRKEDDGVGKELSTIVGVASSKSVSDRYEKETYWSVEELQMLS
jgi:hypothetical protein